MQRIIIGLFFVVFTLTVKTEAQVGGMEFYHVSSSGADKVSVTKMEYAWFSIAYQEKKMNNWYEKFWVDEGFKSPEDMFVHVEVSTLNQEAFVIVFDVTKPVSDADSAYEVHARIAQMLAGDLEKRIHLESTSWIQWLAAVNESYKDDSKQNSLFNNTSFRYIIPKDGDITELDSVKGIGSQQMRVSAKDLAFLYMSPALDDLNGIYKDFLKFSGFNLFQDAEIILERNKADDDLLSFVFVMSRTVARSDRDLRAHRNMAKRFQTFVNRKSEPIKTSWLRFRFEADTTGNIRDRVWLTN